MELEEMGRLLEDGSLFRRVIELEDLKDGSLCRRSMYLC